MKPRSGNRWGARRGHIRYSAVELLIAIALLITVTPFLQDLPHGQFIEDFLVAMILISSIFAIGLRGRLLWTGWLLAAGTLVARWTVHVHPQPVVEWVFHGAALLFLIYVVLALLRFVVDSTIVDSEVICAACAAYLLLGMIFALNYVMIGKSSPAAFAFSTGPEADRTMSSFNAFYFSFVVLSTVGFGDITPVSKLARTLTIIEAIAGMFYVTVLIARLVSAYAPRPNHAETPEK